MGNNTIIKNMIGGDGGDNTGDNTKRDNTDNAKRDNTKHKGILEGLKGTAAKIMYATCLITALSAAAPVISSCLAFVQRSKVTINHSRKYEPPNGISGWWYEGELADAVMDFIKDNNYPNIKFGVWGRPLKEIDYALEERVNEIAELAVDSCEKYKDIYPVDPAMLMAGMYIESTFYEFAISDALAVGVAQFINGTASSKKFGMLCAGDIEEHSTSSYKLPELAEKFNEYKSRKAELADLESELSMLEKEGAESKKNGARNGGKNSRNNVEGNSLFKEKLKEKERLKEAIEEAKEGYKAFLRANFEGRDILDDDDREFLNGFDQRAVLEKAVPAMALYIAESLRALNGDVMTAWVSYNAGLGSTTAKGYMKKYGKISNVTSANYAHTIVQIAEDINRRIFGG